MPDETGPFGWSMAVWDEIMKALPVLVGMFVLLILVGLWSSGGI